MLVLAGLVHMLKYALMGDAPRVVDRVNEQAEGGNRLIAVQAKQPSLRTRMRLHGGDLDGDKAHAPLCTPPIEGDHALRRRPRGRG